MAPELSIITMCFKEGRTGDDCESDKLGTRCFMSGRWDRVFSFGVVMNNLVSTVIDARHSLLPTVRSANSSSSSE